MKTYNQIQPATSRTLPCGSRPSSQPPLHTVLQTYMDRSWDYVPMRSVPELSSDVTGVVQGYFFGLDGKKISIVKVLDLLRKDKPITRVLGRLSADENQRREYLITALLKIWEGCDQTLDEKPGSPTYNYLVERIIFFLGLIKKGQPDRPEEAVLLKLNRLAGSLQKRTDSFRGEIPMLEPLKGISLILERFIGINKFEGINEFEIVKPILPIAIQLLQDFKRMIGEGRPQGQWFLFETLSLFGPLFHNLSILFPGMNPAADGVHLELREIRQLMETNPAGISVVAHRGMGPTNRSMGGLIAQGDPRRLNRLAENSPEAFGAAMGFAGRDGLDGVECDVFLSADGIPILSHEEKVREQLREEMQQYYEKYAPVPTLTDDSRIGDLDSQTLLGLQRTATRESRFMTLEELLGMAAPVARDYYSATGKPFRVEVEMKGTNIKGWDPGQVVSNRREMEVSVARVISQFKKTMPDIPIEILLFNSNAEEVQGYARKRREKTALGAIYTGLNAKERELAIPKFTAVKFAAEKLTKGKSASEAEAKKLAVRELDDEARAARQGEGGKPLLVKYATEQLTELRPDIDELRYMFSNDPDFSFTKRHQKDFIQTLVYGSETAPGTVVDMSIQPTGQVAIFHGTDYPIPLNDFTRLLLLLPEARLGEPNKIHLLTDYAMKATYLKRALHPDNGFTQKEVEGVFALFEVVVANIRKDKEEADASDKASMVDKASRYAAKARADLEIIERSIGRYEFVPLLIAKARADCDQLDSLPK